jgi:menaquinone-dependent protoporphyrinogen oxidase
MKTKILVAYGSRHGSTSEVASAIAATLAEEGLRVDLRPAGEVHDLGGYDGIVLGGALYMSRLHTDVRRLLKRFREELAQVPVAVFAMGPLTMEAKDVAGSRKQLDRALAKVPEVRPVTVAIFGGVVRPEELRFPFSAMPGSDGRDWDAIEDWAKEVAASLVLSRVAVGV